MKIILKHWWFYLFLVLSILTIWPLFLPGYFSHHDDLQVMRIFEMRRCLLDLQIPCRWVPDMGYGNGFPIFNFYSAFPYYLGAILSFILGYIGAAKALFFIPLVFGGISMYLLGKELFGKVGGVIAAVLFMFAPYRALDTYIRGDIAENFSLALLPLIFYFLIKLIKQKSLKNFLIVAILFGIFLTTHNILTMIFTPIVLIWSIYFLIREKSGSLVWVILSLLTGFFLAAFFIVPAFLEKSLVQVDTLTRLDLDYRAHFVTIRQLFFSRFWGYGASIPGPNDTISFQIGWPHWWLVAVVFILTCLSLVKRSINFKNLSLLTLLAVLALAAIFMTHTRSAFIWKQIDILKFTQFPWRFISVAIIFISLLGASITLYIKNVKYRYFVVVVILTTTVILNWTFFKPAFFYNSVTDQKKLSGQDWENQQKAAILDYLPKTGLEPKEAAPKNPIVTSGQADISDFKLRSSKWSFTVTVQKEANIEVPVFDFPNWEVRVDGLKVAHSHQNYLGRIGFTLKPGKHKVVGKFTNTPVRSASNAVSFISLLVIVSLFIYGKNHKKFI